MKLMVKRILSLILTFAIILSMVACASEVSNSYLFDPNPQIIVENIITENIETEKIITEHITAEIYLEELAVAEHKISELLLEEKTITEVLLCKTIYVSQDTIEEFSEHSQITVLFGDGFDISSVLKKIAVGTGIIVTLVVVKKIGLPDPIANAVFAAADKSMQFASGGAVIGSLFGGLTGAANEIDQSGRTSAVLGFAMATAGLILSIVSLAAEIPSGGSTTLTLGSGIKLVIAGVSVIAATGETAYKGYNAVKTFVVTDSSNINWEDIDWNRVGASSVQKAINNGADGYMWGSIIGAVYGGAEGYDFYHKYNTPYTDYNNRWAKTPVEGDRGHWTGDRGESDFVLNEPIELPDGTVITQVHYHNAVPDFSPYTLAEVKIPNMTNDRYSIESRGIVGNFEKADTALAEYWTQTKYQDRIWTGPDVKDFRENYPYKLTWHEMSNMESMQLVPYDVNNTFGHYGGVAEYNAMIKQEGALLFD